MELTPELVREYMNPKEAQHTADCVKYDVCTCCGLSGSEEERLECGHILCVLCQNRQHICIACALAV